MQVIAILLNPDIIMVFARKKQLAASNILVYTHVQALQEYSRTLREETFKYKFTDDYS